MVLRTNTRRAFLQWRSRINKKNQSVLMYASAGGILLVGLSYASVPLYRMFCSSTGLGGTPSITDKSHAQLRPLASKKTFRVHFDATISPALPWSFYPTQSELKVIPGQTALAFYTARNNASKPIVGVSTYNVAPARAGAYFEKVQCFCFEEQLLEPGEEVDMPVFFFLDPDIVNDPQLKGVDTITLSYTFFNTKI